MTADVSIFLGEANPRKAVAEHGKITEIAQVDTISNKRHLQTFKIQNCHIQKDVVGRCVDKCLPRYLIIQSLHDRRGKKDQHIPKPIGYDLFVKANQPLNQ